MQKLQFNAFNAQKVMSQSVAVGTGEQQQKSNMGDSMTPSEIEEAFLAEVEAEHADQDAAMDPMTWATVAVPSNQYNRENPPMMEIIGCGEMSMSNRFKRIQVMVMNTGRQQLIFRTHSRYPHTIQVFPPQSILSTGRVMFITIRQPIVYDHTMFPRHYIWIVCRNNGTSSFSDNGLLRRVNIPDFLWKS